MSKNEIKIWALAWDNPTEAGNAFVSPALDDDGTDSFLAFPSKEQAERGAAFQKEMYDCDCHPVRLA
jgi:hypothetical protein